MDATTSPVPCVGTQYRRSVFSVMTQVVDDGLQCPIKNQAVIQHGDRLLLQSNRQVIPMIFVIMKSL